MSIQTLIDGVAAKANIQPQVAEKVAGIVLSVLQHESPEISGQIFANIPGAQQLATANDVMTQAQQPSSGIIGTISNLLGGAMGEKVGALVNGVAALKASGLTEEQINAAGSQVITYARQTDPQLVNQLVQAVPELRGHFGL
ncbi:DUF2267 domain-containing protein [Phyllobacterium salinisoli]|uniref:DUF2267 domain-containing protein n=1 Tax=Phyllobacterium salinisoli TaxID=1899321 RepID=A0A368K702_9HYPH|nr:DUF2267 domain-containing protein [Phyllobacterium salinisoli]RCS25168.1 DUF2267 domain-containing protein [Phyllobacterium salinisoli]